MHLKIFQCPELPFIVPDENYSGNTSSANMSSRLLHTSHLNIPQSTITSKSNCNQNNTQKFQQRSKSDKSQTGEEFTQLLPDVLNTLQKLSNYGASDTTIKKYLKEFEKSAIPQIYWNELKPVLKKQMENLEKIQKEFSLTIDRNLNEPTLKDRQDVEFDNTPGVEVYSKAQRFEDPEFESRMKKIEISKNDYENSQFLEELEFLQLQNIPQHELVQLMDDPDFDMLEKNPEFVANYLNNRYGKRIMTDSTTKQTINDIIPESLVVKKNIDVAAFSESSRGCILPSKIDTFEMNVLDQSELDLIELQIKLAALPTPDGGYASEHLADYSISETDFEETSSKSVNDVLTFIDYPLQLQPFKVQNFFQLKGSNVPRWCPKISGPNPHNDYEIGEILMPERILKSVWGVVKPK